MPSIVEGDQPDFKSTYDILTDVINDVTHPTPQPDPTDCINDYGQHQGQIEGRANIEAQFNGDTPATSDPMQQYMAAYQTCAPDGFGTPDPIHFPSLENPVVTGLEVALTPSTLNSGEDQSLAAPNVFHQGYNDGYTQGQIEGFDAHLEQHFAQPEPEPVVASPMDSMIPSLTVDPHDYSTPDYSTHDIGSFDTGAPGYSDSGSSSGDSSSVSGGSDTSGGN